VTREPDVHTQASGTVTCNLGTMAAGEHDDHDRGDGEHGGHAGQHGDRDGPTNDPNTSNNSAGPVTTTVNGLSANCRSTNRRPIHAGG
jgi:hypothetical protein